MFALYLGWVLSPSLSPMVCFSHELMLWGGDGGLWDS